MSFKVWLSEPMPHQIPILDDPARFKVLVCGRRFGKTEVLKSAAIVGHGPEVDGRPLWKGALYGGNVWWVLPTLRSTLAREIWESLLRSLREVLTWKSETERRIHLPGGGSITMKSSDDPETLRGPGLDLGIFDELKDHTREAWDNLRPALSDKHGSGIFAGTPPRTRSSDNLATHLFDFAANHEGWRRWQRPSSDNPMMTEEELAAALEEVGTFVFAREYLAKFAVPGGGKFKEEWFRSYDRRDGRVFLGEESFRYDELRCFGTCDLAASTKSYSDHTVIASWGLIRAQLLLLEIVRSKIVGAQTLKAMRKAVAKWNHEQLYIESTAYHTDLIDIARNEPLPIVELHADRDKLARAEPAMAAAERGRIWLPRTAPWLQAWKDEVLSFEGAPADEDDQVDTLSYATAVAFKARKTVADGVTPTKKGPTVPSLGVRALPSLRPKAERPRRG